jgi:biliverdin reductase / flavin reductase
MTHFSYAVSSSDSRGFLIRWILIPMLRPILMNMREMEVYLNTDCSDIDFTVVRPPGLGRGASSGKLFREKQNYI